MDEITMLIETISPYLWWMLLIIPTYFFVGGIIAGLINPQLKGHESSLFTPEEHMAEKRRWIALSWPLIAVYYILIYFPYLLGRKTAKPQPVQIQS